MRRPVPPRARQPPEYLPVVTEMQSLAHDGGTQNVPAQPFQSRACAGGNDVTGVEIEALPPRMAPDSRALGRILEIAWFSEARDRLSPAIRVSDPGVPVSASV